MPVDTFNITNRSGEQVVKALGEVVFDGDFAAGFAGADRSGITSAAAVGVISVDDDKPDSWIRAGLCLEHLWLEAERLGLGLGIMTALVESGVHNTLLKVRLGMGRQRPVAVFRLGKPTDVVLHSPRVGLSEIIDEC